MQQALTRGEKLSDELARHGELFPPVVNQLVIVGEKTGTLSKTTVHIRAHLRREVETYTNVMLGTIEPVMTAGLAMTLGPVGNLAQAGDLPTEPHSPVLFLPAKADVFSLGVKSVARLDDSSDDARANIDTATLQAATESRRFRRIELPELSADERAVVDEFLAVSGLVFLQMGSHAGKADARIDRADIDRRLGPSLPFLL